jgi:hypothetical protein
MSFDKNLKSIQSNRLFQDVSPKDIKISVNSKNFLEMNEGEVIYQNGDNSDSFYLLLKGQIKIKIYGIVGAPPLVKKFDNDFFGEYELLENTPRKSAAMAVEKSLIYRINRKELRELVKNKTILANLFNSTSAIASLNQKVFDELEVSSELSDDEYKSIEIFEEASSSSSLEPENFDESDENLSWNSLNANEVNDYSLDEELEKDRSKTILSNAIDQTGNVIESFKSNDSEFLFSTKESLDKIEKDDNSILDQIKKEIKASKSDEEDKTPDENIPPESSSIESGLAPQVSSEEFSNKAHQEIIKKVTQSIYDEIKTPLELIKKYSDLLIQKSSSAEANKVLQKIIDQSNVVIDSLQIHADYFNEKIKLKTQVLYATNALNDILHLLAGYTEFRKVKLFRKFEADASILLDKNLFYQAGLQIVKFLCENIAGEGSIFVTTLRTKETIIIEFKSNGPKLPDEQLKKISGEFISIENPGLVFTRRIIFEHNGTLVSQNSSDSGPEIKVLLPIVK